MQLTVAQQVAQYVAKYQNMDLQANLCNRICNSISKELDFSCRQGWVVVKQYSAIIESCLQLKYNWYTVADKVT